MRSKSDELVSTLAKEGITLKVLPGNGHLALIRDGEVVRLPSGLPVTISSTPSDRRGNSNALALLRREGIIRGKGEAQIKKQRRRRSTLEALPAPIAVETVVPQPLSLRDEWQMLLAERVTILELMQDLDGRLAAFGEKLSVELGWQEYQPAPPPPPVEPEPEVRLDLNQFTQAGVPRRRRPAALRRTKLKLMEQTNELLIRRRATGEWLTPSKIARSMGRTPEEVLYYSKALSRQCKEWCDQGLLERAGVMKSAKNPIRYRLPRGVKLL